MTPGLPTSVWLPAPLAKQLIDAAYAAGNTEICGFLAQPSDASMPPVVYPIPNQARAAHCRFDMDPAAQIAAFKRMRQRGEELLAIYHSHPDAPAEPSRHDLAGHSYPNAVALIISPAAADGRRLRAWALVAGDARPIPLLGESHDA